MEGSPSGTIPIGDKSSPDDIASYIYGISKTDFKNAIGSLYKDGIVTPGEFETQLVPEEMRSKRSNSKSGRADELARIIQKPDSRFRKDDSKTIFIGNLPFSINEKILENVISKAIGDEKIAKFRLVMDEETKKPRGYAFIDMKDQNYVLAAVDILNGLEVMGRKIRADSSKPSVTRASSDNESEKVKPIERDNQGDFSLDALFDELNEESSKRHSEHPSVSARTPNQRPNRPNNAFEERGRRPEGMRFSLSAF